MDDAVMEVVTEAGWKLQMLLRAKRFYSDTDRVRLYKSHLLSYLEYRTPAIYHAKREVLDKVDRVQSKFLKTCNIDDITALMEFNLAPLAARRDMAMLGVIHRAAIGKGPQHFKDHFRIECGHRLCDPRRTYTGQLIARSALGLVAVYNFLPEDITSAKNVKVFQSGLQSLLKRRAKEGANDWVQTFSPRLPLARRPLR
jgi:hypothetical protein